MKKYLFGIVALLFISLTSKSQNSNEVNKADSNYLYRIDTVKQNTYPTKTQQLQSSQYPRMYDHVRLTPHIYRDTRLGSSSPLYNSYIKNHYGAGAITTNPNKWGSGAPEPAPQSYYTPVDSSQVKHQDK